jgi:isoleucyl-tRNA synthetase/bisphosphoglycerate-dependent phosphoglycerate mutase
MAFDPVDPKQSFPALERGILTYWKEEDTFKRSMKQRREMHGDILERGQWIANSQHPIEEVVAKRGSRGSRAGATPLKEERARERGTAGSSFAFYDGPPFATGLPHYGHLLAGTIKDVIPRYQTMRGHYVERRFGWDCHGLPIENLVEKEQNLRSRKEIEAMGVGAFNDLCRGSVQRYTKEWRQVVERMGRWVDMDWDYRTMDPDYMESLWWVFSELHRKKLIYEGHKPMHICIRCATPLSNFEVGLGYADRTDQSVIATFPLLDHPKTVLLAWTTTPWSLPGNFWLAVGPSIRYARVREGGTTYVLAEKLAEKVFAGKEYEVLGTIKPQDLIGKRYEPLFSYFADTVLPSTAGSRKPRTYGESVFKVVTNDAVEVSDAEGTGIVHLTSSTGEDSNAVANAEGVDVLPHIRMDGSFIEEVTDFVGLKAKPEGSDPMATDKAVIEQLKGRGRCFSSYAITHSYPHCWRCETPLLPYTTSSWFVAVEQIKEKLLGNNAKTRWVPEHIRDRRFGKWLENARDWAISRNRYWGTPLPIWRSNIQAGSDERLAVSKKQGATRYPLPASGPSDIEVIGSRDDLMAKCQIRFTKITVLRHAESEGNLIPIYQGHQPGTSLTKRGREQASVAADFIAEPPIPNPQPITLIYTSPLARAQETAAIIAKKTGAQVVTDERLREVTFGDYEGKHVDFSDLSFVKARRAHKIGSGKPESIYHLDGMEVWSSVYDRVGSFLREVLPKHRSEHIVIVTHADPCVNIRAFFTREDALKLSHQPYPGFAEPRSYFYDHDREAQLDLHKETVDDVTWCGSSVKGRDVALTLVRHGQTDWNAAGKSQGSEVDQPLNDEGRKQVQELAKKLKSKKFDAILCSDLLRASESAEILSTALGVPIADRWMLLRERGLGAWSGDTVKGFESHNRTHVGTINPAASFRTPPDGESLSQFLARARATATKMLREYPGKKILVVCHRGTMQVLRAVVENLSYAEFVEAKPSNAEAVDIVLSPMLQRIPEVLDCWFESGSMPYAQGHYPFAFQSPLSPKGRGVGGEGFPADFIAEGVDQTRGWFYTLMVLATALFDQPAFRNCIVNGIVLAEDGKKMSKRLKNYPEPTEVAERHGADAVRFSLMRSPAVRGEDVRFSEKLIEETVRSVLLPLWNSYSFFVTYANAAGWQPTETRRKSTHPLDRWIRAEVQDLVNRMTEELDRYDLSATCNELGETIDALTNWYVRLSRRRFAGKGIEEAEEASGDRERGEQHDALVTLYDVLLTFSQLLAPFCPFVTEAIYLNLVPEEHGSVHLTDWPEVRELTDEERSLIAQNRVMRTIVSLGNTLRSGKRIKVRQPLAQATVALPPALKKTAALTEEETSLLQRELNVKEIAFTDEPGSLAQVVALVDARTVGPRLGARVQEIIVAGKRGEFTEKPDGSVLILDEVLSPAEVQITYRGTEGTDVAADRGIVVSLDTTVTPALQKEGLARDLIRTIQKLRKDSGLAYTDRIALAVEGLDDVVDTFRGEIAEETRAEWKENNGTSQELHLDGSKVTIRFAKSREERA